MSDLDFSTPAPKEKFIVCSQCSYETPLVINPLVCPKCGYSFPRDDNGNLILEKLTIVEKVKEPNAHNATTEGKNARTSEEMMYSPPQSNELALQPPISLDQNSYFQGSPSQPTNIAVSQVPGPVNVKPPRLVKVWKPSAGFWVPIICLGISAILTLIYSLFLTLFSGSLSALSSSLKSGLNLFIITSFSIVYFLIPYFWIQKYYPNDLTPKQRLAILGLPLNKFTAKEYIREILFGIFMACIGTFVVIGLQILSAYLVEALYHINIADELKNGVLRDFGFNTPSKLSDLLYFVFGVILFVGLPEEVLFRGFVQTSFERKFSKSASLWLTAVYFAIVHIFAYILLPPIFLFLFIPYLGISLLLGYVRNLRGTLYAPIAMHIVYDILEMILLYIILYG